MAWPSYRPYTRGTRRLCMCVLATSTQVPHAAAARVTRHTLSVLELRHGTDPRPPSLGISNTKLGLS